MEIFGQLFAENKQMLILLTQANLLLNKIEQLNRLQIAQQTSN